MPLLLGLSLLASSAFPALRPLQDEAPDEAPTEVLVVGTLHAPWLFRSADYTPAHLRALLAAFEPDVVAVQCPPEWLATGRFLPATYEIPAIVLPWAAARAVPVVGVEPLDLERHEAALDARLRRHASLLTRALEAGPIPPAMYGEVPADRLESTRTEFGRSESDFERVNRSEGEAQGASIAGSGRNQELAARCLEVVDLHPGAKLLVLAGAGHKAVLDALLADRPGVRVLAMPADVPIPTPGQVEAAWTAEDLAASLGHNLDGERSYFHAELNDLPRLSALAGRLASEAGHAQIAAYFQARIAYQQAEYERALELFEAIEPADGGPALYPYPMGQWRMRYPFEQALALERARALAALGRRDEARAALVALYESLPAPPIYEPRAPAAGPAVGALGDAGFETGELAAQQVPGRWWSEEVAAGRQRASRDAEEHTEGEASLRLEVSEARELGRASLVQELEVDESMRAAGELRFDVHCRSEELPDLMLFALAPSPEDGRAVHLARAGARLVPGEWSQTTLRFRCPEEAATIELHLSYEARPGAEIRFDDARLTDDSAPPFADWGASILAREFPRTLLEDL